MAPPGYGTTITSAWAADGGDLAPVDAGDRHGAARVRGVHELAIAEVDADVADRRVIEDQVAGLGVARRHVRRGRRLRGRVAGQVHAGLAPRIVRQTGAVEGNTGLGHRIPVRHAELA